MFRKIFFTLLVATLASACASTGKQNKPQLAAKSFGQAPDHKDDLEEYIEDAAASNNQMAVMKGLLKKLGAKHAAVIYKTDGKKWTVECAVSKMMSKTSAEMRATAGLAFDQESATFYQENGELPGGGKYTNTFQSATISGTRTISQPCRKMANGFSVCCIKKEHDPEGAKAISEAMQKMQEVQQAGNE